MEPTVTVLREIRKRILVAEQSLNSIIDLSRDTTLQLSEMVECATRNLLRLEGYISSQVLERYMTVLQSLLRRLSTADLQSRPRSFHVGIIRRGRAGVYIAFAMYI